MRFSKMAPVNISEHGSSLTLSPDVSSLTCELSKRDRLAIDAERTLNPKNAPLRRKMRDLATESGECRL